MAIGLQSSQDLSDNRANDKKERRARSRHRSHQRLRSYQQILVDFQEQAIAAKNQMGQKDLEENEHAVDEEEGDESDDFCSPSRSYPALPARKENTARRSKRFSSPAVALHTTSVTARTTEINTNNTTVAGDGTGTASTSDAPQYKRFPLVSARRTSRCLEADDVSSGAVVVKNEGEDGNGLAKGVAAAKLAALLKRAKAPIV